MAVFNTYQNTKQYEDALARHGQYVRWTRALLCPCLNEMTHQPDVQCTLCKGRGRIYKPPTTMQIKMELGRHNNTGVIYPTMTPVVAGESQVIRQGVDLVVSASQPSDGSFIQLEPPFPKEYQRLYVNYTFSPLIYVTDENADVIGTNTLRGVTLRFNYRGKTFEGSIAGVTRVYNVDKDETYTVSSYAKEYIYLSDMGTWASGDVLAVSYSYVQPFSFILLGISPKTRYEKPYVLDEADLTMIAPYWATIGPDDLFTALAADQQGSAIIDPEYTEGNDEVKNYFDLSRILAVIDLNGTEYEINTDVELYGRNEIKWLTTKPTVKYTINFLYNPTYRALIAHTTIRRAENKEFANKINLQQYDKVNDIEY